MPDFILGVDFGQKRIGLAVGQTLTRVANRLNTLPNNKQFWPDLKNVISEWNISQIIIGLPLDMAGEEQEITRQVKNFAKKVKQQTELPVHFIDERLTSYEAERQFQSQRQANLSKAKGKSQIDAMAAQIILQSWLDQTNPI
ncbi:MAG: Holliday junction resolvase RuvX [Marinicella sp.]